MQWLWLSWQSGRFQYQRFESRNRQIFIEHLYLLSTVLYLKDENKRKRGREWPIFKKGFSKRYSANILGPAGVMSWGIFTTRATYLYLSHTQNGFCAKALSKLILLLKVMLLFRTQFSTLPRKGTWENLYRKSNTLEKTILEWWVKSCGKTPKWQIYRYNKEVSKLLQSPYR